MRDSWSLFGRWDRSFVKRLHREEAGEGCVNQNQIKIWTNINIKAHNYLCSVAVIQSCMNQSVCCPLCVTVAFVLTNQSSSSSSRHTLQQPPRSYWSAEIKCGSLRCQKGCWCHFRRNNMGFVGQNQFRIYPIFPKPDFHCLSKRSHKGCYQLDRIFSHGRRGEFAVNVSQSDTTEQVMMSVRYSVGKYDREESKMQSSWEQDGCSCNNKETLLHLQVCFIRL